MNEDQAEVPEHAELSLSERLWNPAVTPESFAEDSWDEYQEIVLEQYRLYVTSAQEMSDRRMRSNSFFLTLHTAALAGVAYLTAEGSAETLVLAWITAGVGALGVGLCVSWSLLLRQYRSINSVKFDVIGEFEERLPARPFRKAEWVDLKRGAGARPRYASLASIEGALPWLIGLAYATMICASAVAVGSSEDDRTVQTKDDEPAVSAPGG